MRTDHQGTGAGRQPGLHGLPAGVSGGLTAVDEVPEAMRRVFSQRMLLVLTTGNKSEAAVGYSTLYGDTAGGFSVLRDVYKTTVYDLARYRNTLSKAIPQRIIDREPSAELSEDQKDSDSLPTYDLLDPIIEAYVEDDKTKKEIIDSGFNSDDVQKVIDLINFNEYKRRQVPLGIKISARNFGKDRRYPITNFWKNNI